MNGFLNLGECDDYHLAMIFVQANKENIFYIFFF